MEVPIDLCDYLDVAKRVAWKVWQECRGYYELEELESEALLALVRARDKYDPKRGSSFRTFAASKVYFFVYDWLREQSFLSRREHQRVKAGEREPARFHSLEDQLPRQTPGSEQTFESFLQETTWTDQVVLKDEVATLFRKIAPVDREILTLHYLEGLTMKRVGAAMGLSESRVSQRIAAVRIRFGGLARKVIGVSS